MNNRTFQQSRLRKKLLHRRNDGMEYVIWKLSLQDKEMIEELGYKVEPYNYIVQTKRFFNIKTIYSSFLKDLHYAKLKGQNYIVHQLTKSDKELLDKFYIQYYPLKYKIYLN